MKFLFDANLPPGLPKALEALSAGQFPEVEEVSHLRSKFAPNTPDHTWLTALAVEGNWAVVSQDNFNKTNLEKAIIERRGITVFVLEPAWSKMQHWPKCLALIRWWPKMVAQAALSSAAVRVPINVSKFRALKR